MEDVRLSSSSSKRIWVKYGDGQPVSLMFDRGIVDDLKKAIKKELSPRLDNVAVNEITLRRHGEGEDLRADLTVDENFVNNYDTPLQIIVNAPGMYRVYWEPRVLTARHSYFGKLRLFYNSSMRKKLLKQNSRLRR